MISSAQQHNPATSSDHHQGAQPPACGQDMLADEAAVVEECSLPQGRLGSQVSGGQSENSRNRSHRGIE